jgi:hypothetical protein
MSMQSTVREYCTTRVCTAQRVFTPGLLLVQAAPCLTSQHLTELRVHDCGILLTFPESLTCLLEGLHIGKGHGLRVLDLSECPELVDVDLSGLSILTQLRIAGCKKLLQVQGWSCLPQLEVLELTGCSEQVVCPWQEQAMLAAV